MAYTTERGDGGALLLLIEATAVEYSTAHLVFPARKMVSSHGIHFVKLKLSRPENKKKHAPAKTEKKVYVRRAQTTGKNTRKARQKEMVKIRITPPLNSATLTGAVFLSRHVDGTPIRTRHPVPGSSCLLGHRGTMARLIDSPTREHGGGCGVMPAMPATPRFFRPNITTKYYSCCTPPDVVCPDSARGRGGGRGARRPTRD